MVPIKDCQGLILVKADKDHRAKIGIFLEMQITDRGDLREKRTIHHVLTSANAVSNFSDGVVIAREFPPLSTRKSSDMAEACLPHFYLIPFRFSGEFFPQGKMPYEKESAPFCVLVCVVHVRFRDNATH